VIEAAMIQISSLLKGLFRWQTLLNFVSMIQFKKEQNQQLKQIKQAATTDSLLFNIRVEYSVFVIAFGL
jgi:hypothetical protein